MFFSAKRVAIGFTSLAIGLSSSLIVKNIQAQVPPSGTFTAAQACSATQAINGRNPGNVKLTVGTSYAAVGFNNPQRKFIFLTVPGATPDRRWVSVTCGDFQASNGDNTTPSPTPLPDSSPTPRPTSPSTSPSNSSLLPFFDDENNPVPVHFPKGVQKDITPPAPKLEPFDQKILALCGAGFDAPVDPERFKQLMTFYPDVVRKLKQAAGGGLQPNHQGDDAFIQDLEALWFDKRAFKHVFCGEKDGNSIGGLHFVGRYLQLQQEGIAGRINSGGKTEEVIDGSIYTFGAVIKQGDRVIAQSPVKGYSYVLSAQETLLNGVRAFKQFKPQNVAKDACLFTVTEPQVAPFQAVFVEENRAIRTFYPDATPDSKTRPCDR